MRDTSNFGFGILAVIPRPMVETCDHRALVVHGRRKRVGLGRRFRDPDRLGFLAEPSLVAGDADLIPYLDDIFGLLSHGVVLLRAPMITVSRNTYRLRLAFGAFDLRRPAATGLRPSPIFFAILDHDSKLLGLCMK